MPIAASRNSLWGGLINNKYLFFPVLEAKKSKIKALADSMSIEGLVLIDSASLLQPYMVEEARGLCWGWL